MHKIMNINISGFLGPWGWVKDYESFTKHNIVPIEYADVIFCCDHNSWTLPRKFLGEKYIIANVLDLAEWIEDNQSNIEYIKKFCTKANLVTAISLKIINQLKEMFDIDAKLFYYPSQVDSSIIYNTKGLKKINNIISFCRLRDPGKRIIQAIECFEESKIADNGWTYTLIGPEKLTLNRRYNGVRKLSFLDKETLYNLVATSKFTLMPSIGEGLGLPAIESALCNTIPIVRDIEPMSSIFNEENSVKFKDDEDLLFKIKHVADNCDFYEKINIDKKPFEKWIRDNAFKELDKMLEVI